MTYEKFIVNCGLPSKEEFEEILNAFPDVGDSDECDYQNGKDIFTYLVACYLENNTQYAYCDNVDFENKTLELYDLSLEEYEKVINDFQNKGWKITNKGQAESELLREDINEKLEGCDDITILKTIKDMLTA